MSVHSHVQYVVFIVVQTPPGPCTHPSNTLSVPSPGGGYLSSLVADVTGCGRVKSPWRITVHQGQTIHVSLYDFGLHSRRRTASSTAVAATGESKCIVYAVMWEPLLPRPRNVSLCGAAQRVTSVHKTSSHALHIAFMHDVHNHLPYFVIHYEGMYNHLPCFVIHYKHMYNHPPYFHTL